MKTKKNKDLQYPRWLLGGIPESLVFDDVSLDSILYSAKSVQPTPANAIDLWQRGVCNTIECAEAVAAMLGNRPELILTFTDLTPVEQLLSATISSAEARGSSQRLASLHFARAKLRQADGNLEEAENDYRDAANHWQIIGGASHRGTLDALDSLADLLESKGDRQKAAEIRLGSEISRLAETKNSHRLIEFRSEAWACFVRGDYQRAEDIYRWFLKVGFEFPGTICHLSRILIVTGREDKACPFLDEAWQMRQDAPAYVPPRILFLMAFIDCLEKKGIDHHIKGLRQLMAKGGATLDWTMEPIIDHIAPRLLQEDVLFFKALANVLSGREALCTLDGYPAWSEVDCPAGAAVEMIQ
jgi:tetratricopeptide (TPR) repeat protein